MGCHFPPPGNLSDQRTEPTSPVSPALQVDSLPTEPDELLYKTEANSQTWETNVQLPKGTVGRDELKMWG